MNPTKIALVGYGFIGSQGHAVGYATRAAAVGDVCLAAIADICPARRKAAHEAFPNARIYAGYSEMLEREGLNIDAVDIATPPHMHAEIAMAALRKGLHVLCEKPLAMDAHQAWRMLQTATECRKVIFPCHNYKHAPVVKAVREAIDSGAIGDVRMVTLSTYRTTHARGVTDWKPDWRRNRKYSGGGIAMDHGPHTLYLAFDWIGSYPTSISASMARLQGLDTEDDASFALQFPSGIVHAHLTWNAGIREVIYTIHGDRGAIVVDDDQVRITSRDLAGQLRTEQFSVSSKWMDASHSEWFGSLFTQFRQAIGTNSWVSRDTLEAFRCIQAISAAYRSASLGGQAILLEDPSRFAEQRQSSSTQPTGREEHPSQEINAQ